MEKERIWIFTIIIAVTIGIIVMFRYQYMKTGTIPQLHNENEVITETEEKAEENSFSEACKSYFSNAGNLTVEKVERTVVEDGEGNFTTSYDVYVVSDIDLENQTDQTEDYTKALAEEELDESLIEKTEFQKAFDVDYKDQDGWTIYEKLFLKSGFDGDLENVTFDKETNELTGQKLYVFDQPCSVIEEMLPKDNTGEVLDQKVFYQSMETEDGVVIPEYFSAVVQYRAGDKKITKSLYLQVTVNNWEEESHEADKESTI